MSSIVATIEEFRIEDRAGRLTDRLIDELEADPPPAGWVITAEHEHEDGELRLVASSGEVDSDERKKEDVTPEQGVAYLLPQETMKRVALETLDPQNSRLSRRIGLRDEAIEARMGLAETILEEVANLEGEGTSPFNVLHRLGDRAVEDFVAAFNRDSALHAERAAATGMPIFDREKLKSDD